MDFCSCHPTRTIWWYVKMSKNRSQLRLHDLSYWLRQWWQCADIRLRRVETAFNVCGYQRNVKYYLEPQVVLFIQVSQLHVICLCTAHAMLDMMKYIETCIHVGAHTHAVNINSEHALCTCMFGYLLLSHTPVPSCSMWGYPVCI